MKFRNILFLPLFFSTNCYAQEHKNLFDQMYLYGNYENYSYSDRAVKITSNEEEKLYQWVNENKFPNFILINIPSYKLYYISYIENEEEFSFENYYIEWETQIIVGSVKNKTPMENLSINTIKYNPTWTPTVSMIKRNLIKGDKINIDWLIKHNLKVFNSLNEEVSFDEINKNNVFDYKYIQSLGDSNSLGRIKFETNSKRSIYLHDTNSRSLFKNEKRAYSSGCIRVNNPEHLAMILSKSSLEEINRNISTNKTLYKKVNATPVYFLYDLIDFENKKELFNIYNL